MIAKKIILGSANINHFYGINKNKINRDKFIKLMDYVHRRGVTIIDTSPSYKSSENIIGLSKKNFQVITKIPKIPSNLKIKKIDSWIEKKFKSSKNKLKKKKIYGILVQNAEILLTKKGKVVFNTLLKLKKKYKIKKIGISIYNFETLKMITRQKKIDFVQLPYNVFNQTSSNKKIINNLKKRNIEIHARSIFLQGTLLKEKINLPNKLKKLKNLIIIWKKWLEVNKINPIDACLNHALQNKKIDKIVIGFDSIDNFKEILKFKRQKINIQKFKFNIDQNLLDPRKWS